MLRWRAVTKRYGEHVAVDQLDLRAHEGEVLGFLGPNGAGKTTSLSMAVGLLAPDDGRVEIGAGQNPRDPETRRQVGFAPQELAVYEEMTGRENLHFFGEVQGLRGAELERRSGHVLELVGLEAVGNRRVSTYSGGMKRRLNLAVAIVHQPSLVLLDEPTVGVDPQSRRAIFEKVAQLRSEGVTVIYTTHYMEEAQRLCDRIAILDRGALQAVGTTAELIDAHGGPGTLVLRAGGEEQRVETNDPLATLEEMRRAAQVEEFRYEPPNLESVFLGLTGHALRD